MGKSALMLHDMHSDLFGKSNIIVGCNIIFCDIAPVF